jgi:BASS family bile acid:Na+ symporter
VLEAVLKVTAPALVFATMVVVGSELTAADFRRALRRPVLIALLTAGQVLLWPAGALALRALVPLDPAVAEGALLVALCPAGSMANLYALLGRANVALSVTLTAATYLAALAGIPLWLTALPYLGVSDAFRAPLPTVLGGLGLTVALPMFLGMLGRWRWPQAVQRHRGALLAVNLAALLGLLGLIVAVEAQAFWPLLVRAAPPVAGLTAAAWGVGWGLGWGAGRADRFTAGTVFAVRNLGVATALAVTALGRLEFAAFATAFWLVQTPLLVTLALLARRRGEGP